MPTESSISTARPRASCLPMLRWARIASTIWLPIRWTGLKDVIGSWKTMPIRSPRTVRSSPSPAATRSVPRSSTRPSIRALGERVSPMIVWAVTLLPAPDSPTIARTSPGERSKETRSTAGRRPPSVAKETERSRTESSGAALIAPAPPSLCRLPEPHPRVELRVGDVDQGVEKDDEEGAEHGDGDQRRQVEVPDRFGRVLADAVKVEQSLRENRPAADHGAEVEAEQGDDRDQRVSKDVPCPNLALRQALGPRRPHVVLVHRVEHVRAQDPAVEADVENRQGHQGKDQVVGPVDGILAQADVAARREQLDLEGQVDEQDPGEPEDGHRDPDQRHDRQQAVGEASGPDRREVPEEDPEEHPDRGRADAERERRRHPGPDFLDDVGLVLVGDEIAGEDQLHHRQVLDRQRVVEAPFPFDVLDQLDVAGALLARDPGRRVRVGYDVEDEEDDHRDREEDDHHPQQAPDREARHQAFLTSGS